MTFYERNCKGLPLKKTMDRPASCPALADDRVEYRRKRYTRSKNYEDSAYFPTNFLFCFYFPYICRISPLIEDDVPVPAEDDRTDVTVNQISAKWVPLHEQYLADLEQFERSKETNPK